jgi:crotonobetaine/carnitine-CoA ligase
VKSELGEQDLMVAIEAEPGHTPTAREIHEFCRGRVADYAVPRYIRFVESLPRTGTQRVQKAALSAEGVTADTVDLQPIR